MCPAIPAAATMMILTKMNIRALVPDKIPGSARYQMRLITQKIEVKAAARIFILNIGVSAP